MGPAAGVNASANDMSIWLRAQLGQYPDILSLDTLAKQTRPYAHTKKKCIAGCGKSTLMKLITG